MSDDVSAAVAWFRESPDERIPWIGSPPMGLYGNAQRHAVAIVQAALADQPPADLPATLASVDDVRRVCEAAGLERGARTDTPEWADRHVAVVYGVGTPLHPAVAVYLSGGRGYVDLWASAPAVLLWHAIQAARSAS